MRILIVLLLLTTSTFAQKFTIPLTTSTFGYDIEVETNGVEATFRFDTGASGVFITQAFYDELTRTGKISDSDKPGLTTDITLADGTTKEVSVIRIRTLKIGGATFRNVMVEVGESKDDGMLLGKTILDRMKYYKVEDGKLTFELKHDQKYCEDSQEARYYYESAEDEPTKTISLLQPYVDKKKIQPAELELYAMALYDSDREKEAIPYFTELLNNKDYKPEMSIDLYAADACFLEDMLLEGRDYLNRYLTRKKLTESALLSTPKKRRFLGQVYFSRAMCEMSYGYYDEAKKCIDIIKNTGFVLRRIEKP